MHTDNTYTKLNSALINAGLDPAKALTQPTMKASEFYNLCLETGHSPAAICEAAGI